MNMGSLEIKRAMHAGYQEDLLKYQTAEMVETLEMYVCSAR